MKITVRSLLIGVVSMVYSGKTIHFAPFKGAYFLFRILEDEVSCTYHQQK